MPEIIQPSFAKGELAPELHGRVDTAAYRIGLATARNAIVHTYGGISRRPGSQYIGPVADHTYAPRLIEFQFKTDDNYILEFGDAYMRVIRDEGHVTTEEATITGITQANPAVVTTSGSHGYSNNDEVYIEGVSGMTEVNQNRYYIANVTATTFELTDQITGANVDSTGFTAYSSGGTVAKIFELVTPYAIEDLPEVKFTQSADVMTLVHPFYNPRELSRTDHDAWSIDEIPIGPDIDSPADITVTVNTSGSETDRYKVTAISRETGEESVSGLEDTEATITGITQASPGVVTTSGSHGYSDGDEIQIDNVVGMTEVNTQRYIVANKTSTTFELTDRDGFDIDTSGFTAYSSAGITRRTFNIITTGAATKDNTLAWTAVTGAGRYAVYRYDNGIYGLIGETETNSFLDDDITPDLSDSPPTYRDPFPSSLDNPGAVGYYEQRRVFGGSLNSPDTSEFSQPGNQANFNKTQPTRDDDAITATLNSQQVNEIRHYVALNDLLVFTSGSEWRLDAGNDVAFTPETIRQKPQTYWGASHLPPQVSGNVVLFVEENENTVRSIGYSFALDGYTGNNLGILSQHLLFGHTLVDWCYTHSPEGRLYIVRDDGDILAMSFDQEQEVIAWTHWDTSGDYEAISRLRHGGDNINDRIYTVVKRTVNGNTVRYIEKLEQEFFDDVRDCFFVDSGLSYDEPVTISDVDIANPVVVTTSSAHGFSDGDEVDLYDIVWEPDTDEFSNETQPDQLNKRRYVVANKTATTFELTDSDGNDIDGTAFNDYVSGGTARLAVDSVSGLEHLEGREVKCLADGNIVSGLTVSDASVTLPRKFSRIHIGLANVCDIETLNVEVPSGGTIQGFDKKINKVTLKMLKSRGGYYGPDVNNLVEFKQRKFEALGAPTDMLTGEAEIYLKPSWNSNGRVFIRQDEPLPLTILAIIPSIQTGEH